MGIHYVDIGNDRSVQVQINSVNGEITAMGYCEVTGRAFDIDEGDVRFAVHQVRMPSEGGYTFHKHGYVEEYNKDRYYLGVWSTVKRDDLISYARLG